MMSNEGAPATSNLDGKRKRREKTEIQREIRVSACALPWPLDNMAEQQETDDDGGQVFDFNVKRCTGMAGTCKTLPIVLVRIF